MKNLTGLLLTLSLPTVLALASCDRKQTPAGATAVKTESSAGEGDWCAEHGVPESICTRCNPNLIASFKQKGDWCKEHNLPESQCIACNPDLKAKFETMAPKHGN